MKKVGIYHDQDLDGLASAAIMKKAHPDIRLIGFDYGRDYQALKEQVGDATHIFMADVSLPPHQMIDLAFGREQLFWIDHHISAINEWNDGQARPDNIGTHLLDGTSACELCWDYFFPGKILPTGIYLLGRYDTWRKEWREEDPHYGKDLMWDTDILAFQFGMRTVRRNNIDFIHDNLLVDGYISQAMGTVDKITESGRDILSYIDQQRQFIAKHPIEVTYNGPGGPLKGIALNTTEFNSGAFDPIWDPEKYHFMMPFRNLGTHYKCSLYTTREDVDCSAIAKTLGGGGHRKAAGFQTPYVPVPSIPIKDRSALDELAAKQTPA